VHDDRPSNHRSAMLPAPWFESDTADGSICAPVEDMLAYERLLLNGGEGPWGRVMSPESFALMTTPHATPEDGVHSGRYGYGLNIEEVDGHRYLGHQGGMVGHYTSMLMDADAGIGVMVIVNGPGDPEEVARFAMLCMRRSSESAALPEVPPREDAFRTARASEYVGHYAGPDGGFEVTDREGTMHLRRGGAEAVMEPREGDTFLVDAEAFGLFLLEFERSDGRVARAHHGARTYTREGAPEAPPAAHAGQRTRLDGHYRSQNPWLSNFRVVQRGGGLMYVPPEGDVRPMVLVGENRFRIGADERSPERITFDGVIDGVATSAVVSGGGRFGRTFTP
jgi:hypothetical protein